MILPIYTYGTAVLRKVARPIDKDFPELSTLIENMFETMYKADGIGLAAPQVGYDIRLLIIDLSAMEDDNGETVNFKKVMINPEMLEMSDDTEVSEEGCLSIPGIHENVARARKIKIRYFDENFNEFVEEYEDFFARVIQHEYDHLEGDLFTDKVSPIRRQLLKSKLTNIVKGKTSARYKIKSA